MRFIVMILLGLLSGPALAADPPTYEDGKAAYEAGDYKTAYDIWLPLAESGDAEAQFLIGNLLSLTKSGMKNLQNSQKWLIQAISQDHIQAQLRLSVILLSGYLEKVYLPQGFCLFHRVHEKQPELTEPILQKLNAENIKLHHVLKYRKKEGMCITSPLR